jgi:hypothetical protein
MPPSDHDVCSIMCAHRLWRRVHRWKPDSESRRGAAGSRLGPWAATISKDDEPTPVLAIDVSTYFTVAFRFGDDVGFHEAFGSALGAALEDLGVSVEQRTIEVAAVQGLPFTRLVDATLRHALNTVEFVCGIELSYHEDLRVVQRRLNEFPHPLPPDSVPEAAIRRLFDMHGGAASGHVH